MGGQSRVALLYCAEDISERVSSIFNTTTRLKETDCEVQDPKSKLENLRSDIKRQFAEINADDILQTYEIYNDLILLPSSSLRNCQESLPHILKLICDTFRV